MSDRDTRIVDFIVKYHPDIQADRYTRREPIWRLRWRDPWRLEPLAVDHPDFRHAALLAAEEMDRRDPELLPKTVDGMRAYLKERLSPRDQTPEATPPADPTPQPLTPPHTDLG